MAKNLREKIPSDDVLMIQDVNKDAVRRFVEELSGFNVIPAENAREIAERSVRQHCFPQIYNLPFNDDPKLFYP
jgi:hypothetical protein